MSVIISSYYVDGVEGEFFVNAITQEIEKIMKAGKRTSENNECDEGELLVKGRKINVEKNAMGCASFDFDELCNNPLGSEDYLAIAREFEIVFIRNIPKLSSD